MDLGKVFVTQGSFSKNSPTTWLIDKFHEKDVDGKCYNTIKLTWIFSIIMDKGIYPVSLYIKSNPVDYKKIYDTAFTFTSLKSKYANRGYTIEQCKDDPFLNVFVEAFLKQGTHDADADVEFDKSICFRAQDSYGHDGDKYGRAFGYYIVGAHFGRSIK